MGPQHHGQKVLLYKATVILLGTYGEVMPKNGFKNGVIHYRVDHHQILVGYLKELAIQTAKKKRISYQLSQSRGGTDAGRIHIHKAGCPSIVIAVPTRHIHTHVSLASLKDIENTCKLTLELVKTLDKEKVKKLLPI